MAEQERPIVVYGALAANLGIAVAKFIAAALTGSSAMISEGIHSLVDTGNQLLLLFGIHRGRAPADHDHPYGHGRALYFWSLVVRSSGPIASHESTGSARCTWDPGRSS